MTPVLLDTGCIVALLDRSETHHSRCLEALRAVEGPLVKNVERGVFRLPFRLDEGAATIRSLMKRYARVPMDFADACLVALADVLDTGRILTLDSDFRVYRWRRTRAFDLLIDILP